VCRTRRPSKDTGKAVGVLDMKKSQPSSLPKEEIVTAEKGEQGSFASDFHQGERGKGDHANLNS